MVVTQHRSNKKPSGSRYNPARSKRKYETGSLPTHTRLGGRKVKIVRTKGGARRTRILSAETVNLLDPKTNKHTKAKITTVSQNPANRHFVRRNILTKGTIIETEKGKARITNRPGQEGAINAVLVSE